MELPSIVNSFHPSFVIASLYAFLYPSVSLRLPIFVSRRRLLENPCSYIHLRYFTPNLKLHYNFI